MYLIKLLSYTLCDFIKDLRVLTFEVHASIYDCEVFYPVNLKCIFSSEHHFKFFYVYKNI